MATAAKKKPEAAKPGKRMVVDLTSMERGPDFHFEGDWCGKDVRIVLRHISQAYRRNQIARAKAMAKEQEPTLQPTGVSNDGTN